MADPWWPLFDLRVRTPRIELRLPRDEDLYSLIDAFQQGVHDPTTMPFRIPWTDNPSPQREREALQWWWRNRAAWQPDRWTLTLAAVVAGEVVGMQDVTAEQFASRRVVSTGSWLVQSVQGQGLGKEMRLAVLHLAFDGLGAVRAETGAFEDNAASLGVTRSLGYEPNGSIVAMRRNEPATCLEFAMDREGFDRIRRDDVSIEQLEPCLEMFGVDAAALVTDSVIGVDGCPGGWVAVTAPSQGVGPSVVEVAARFDELVDRAAILIGVDMPIGLSDEVRDCDRAARARLGRRACCVFSAPPRSCLGAPDHAEACRRSLAARGIKLSLQAFHLLPKIAEVDAVMSPARVGQIVEIHPELAFASMADRVLLTPKRTRDGHVERQQLLAPWFPDLAEHLDTRPRGVKADDLLDAFAVAWSARRVLAGTAERLGDGSRDRHDLPIEIWA